MSLFSARFQVVSDLHLETPLQNPMYGKFRLDIKANNLLLLGDIGLVKDEGLYTWLESLLKSTPNLKIFYIFGNHEYYQLSPNVARERMETFTDRMRHAYGERLIFMHRRRYDLGPRLTILGCTLWSHAHPEVQNRLTDFNETRGIREWGIQDHNEQHVEDLCWLNDQVQKLEKDPGRQILIMTHHSPTLDSRANDPAHVSSPVRSGFVTDLSHEPCWTSPAVKMWAFGHTHYNCAFHDDIGKVVIANQKGYSGLVAVAISPSPTKMVEADGECWRIIEMECQATKTPIKKKTPTNAKESPNNPRQPKKSFFRFASNRLRKLFTRRSQPTK